MKPVTCTTCGTETEYSPAEVAHFAKNPFDYVHEACDFGGTGSLEDVFGGKYDEADTLWCDSCEEYFPFGEFMLEAEFVQRLDSGDFPDNWRHKKYHHRNWKANKGEQS